MALTRKEALKNLGLETGASAEEIKKAYRKLSMKHHPDREGGNESEFKKIKEAFELLEKPDIARAKNPFEGYAESGRSVEDIMNDMIAKHAQHQQQRQKARQSFSSIVEVPLVDAFKGVERNCTFSICGETGYKIEVAKGLVPGCPLRHVVGKNASGEDVHVDVRLAVNTGDYTVTWANEPYLYGGATEGSGNIEKPVKIDWLTILFGGFIRYETIDGGTLEVRIIPGIEAGTRLKIKGRGYWKDAHCTARGDVFLHVVPVIPKISDLSEEELDRIAGLLQARKKPEVST